MEFWIACRCLSVCLTAQCVCVYASMRVDACVRMIVVYWFNSNHTTDHQTPHPMGIFSRNSQIRLWMQWTCGHTYVCFGKQISNSMENWLDFQINHLKWLNFNVFSYSYTHTISLSLSNSFVIIFYLSIARSASQMHQNVMACKSSHIH